MNVLLIGREYSLAWELPQILMRAGFIVDVITSDPVMKYAKFIRHLDVVGSQDSLIPTIRKRIIGNYDWIIVTEDSVLTEILQSNLSLEEKMKLLPVQSKADFRHLYSKIKLSQLFSQEKVNTPPFVIAEDLKQALIGAAQLGYPVLVKRDVSGGGGGVFECKNAYEFSFINPKVFNEPVLIQKKISGIELDVSSLFLEGQLIHFSHAKIEKVTSPFGPSSLRTYRPMSNAKELLFRELQYIGKVLGAHGFVNLACIQSEGARFYFEADMRPTVWVQAPKFCGDDPAVYIRKWFLYKEALSYPIPASLGNVSQIVVPYFLRLKRWELIVNRYSVWNFLPKEDRNFAILLIIKRFFSFDYLKLIKRLIPRKYHNKARRIRDLFFVNGTRLRNRNCAIN